MKHPQHIVCVKSSKFVNRENGYVDYELSGSDLFIGQRELLEKDLDFRQVLPMVVLMHGDKIWAYERTSSGGEERLHNKVAVFVGGHFDLEDILHEDSVIDVDASIKQAVKRELAEEVIIGGEVVSTRKLDKCICADETEVDKYHMAIVTVVQLSQPRVESKEPQLKAIGFLTPEELLTGGYNLETWARLACESLSVSGK